MNGFESQSSFISTISFYDYCLPTDDNGRRRRNRIRNRKKSQAEEKRGANNLLLWLAIYVIFIVNKRQHQQQPTTAIKMQFMVRRYYWIEHIEINQPKNSIGITEKHNYIEGVVLLWFYDELKIYPNHNTNWLLIWTVIDKRIYGDYGDDDDVYTTNSVTWNENRYVEKIYWERKENVKSTGS